MILLWQAAIQRQQQHCTQSTTVSKSFEENCCWLECVCVSSFLPHHVFCTPRQQILTFDNCMRTFRLFETMKTIAMLQYWFGPPLALFLPAFPSPANFHFLLFISFRSLLFPIHLRFCGLDYEQCTKCKEKWLVDSRYRCTICFAFFVVRKICGCCCTYI